MSTFKKYLSIVTEDDQFMNYYEAKAYFDDMVRTGKIQSYDEANLKDLYKKGKKFLKNKILPMALAGGIIFSPNSVIAKSAQESLSNPKNNAEYSETINTIKDDIQGLELNITKLKRHTIEFKNASQSQKYRVKLDQSKQEINKLKQNKNFDKTKLDYYIKIIESLEKYLKDGETTFDQFDQSIEKLEKENKDFNDMMKRNEEKLKAKIANGELE